MPQNDFLNNRFSGEVRPIKKQRSENPPVLEKELRFAVLETQSGQYWTNIKVQIKPATLEYPNPSLFVGFNNGNGRCFAKATPDDLVAISNFIQEILPLVVETLSNEQGKADFVKQKLEEFDKAQQFANSIGLQLPNQPKE